MMEERLLHAGERIDDLQCKGLRLIQDPGRFCFGIDAVLLANYARAKAGDRVLDLGTGTGIVPILMSAKTEAARLEAVEIQHESADMARRSVELNNLQDRIEIIEGDIKTVPDCLPKSAYDVVTSNPPYMIDDHGIKNDHDYMAIARHEVLCSLEDVVAAAASCLRPGGNFYMVHRPFRLNEIMGMLTHYHLEPKRMRLVYPYIDKEPNMVLIEAKRGARPNLIVEKPLIVYDAPGEYNREIFQIYGPEWNKELLK